MSNVTIINFDELYQRIVDLIEILSTNGNQQDSQSETNNKSDIVDCELPF